MIGLLLFTPSYYSAGTRGLFDLYQALYPSKEFVGIPGTAFVAAEYPQELCNYFMVDKLRTNTVTIQANRNKDKIFYDSGSRRVWGILIIFWLISENLNLLPNF